MRGDILKNLFDANIILCNSKLDTIISDTINHYYGKTRERIELSDDEAEFLAAAGDISYAVEEKKVLFPGWENDR